MPIQTTTPTPQGTPPPSGGPPQSSGGPPQSSGPGGYWAYDPDAGSYWVPYGQQPTDPQSSGTVVTPGVDNSPSNAAPQGGGQQGPGIFGTGMYAPPPFQVFQPGITGQPVQGYQSNYGLNDVWGQMQNEVQNLGKQGGQMATAPQGTAAQGTAAQGTAAQGAAALGNASQWQAAQLAAMQAAPVQLSTAGDASFQNQQQNLANILGAQAAGYGTSPADIQLQQGRDANIASQLAVLGSQRGSGGNAALATRSAADQAAAANAQLNGQLGLQRAQETLQAQQALGGVLGTARGQAQNYNLNAAQLAQQGNQFNVSQGNQVGLANLAALNAQNEGNAQLSQQMGLANLQDVQGMNLANLGYQNQFGLANLGNAQQTGMANLNNAQQMGLANLGLAGQYGLANQQMSLSNAQLYDQELNAMLGGMTGIGESNRAANLAGQQLGVQQQLGLGQIGEQAFQAAAQSNANLAQALLGMGIGGLGGLYSAFSGNNSNSSGGGSSGGGDSSYTQDAGSSVTGGASDTGSAVGDTLSSTDDIRTPWSSSDETRKTDIRDGAEDVTKALERRRGDTRSSPYAEVLRRTSSLYALSDKNLKEGIEGGNPMLDSFLRQYHDSMSTKEPTADVGEGLGFHNPTMMRAPSAGGAGPNAGSGIMQMASAIPFLGTAVGLLGGLSSATAGSNQNGATGGSGGPMVQTGSGSGITTEGDIGKISDDEDGNADDEGMSLSDDREKEAVMSGNRGMQSFLEQQGAQTGAQNQQGGYSNAFMQTGMAPNNQMDRQLPPWMGGYGGGMPGYGSQFGMGGVYGGGMSGYGGFGGSGLAFGGGITQGSTVTPGGVSNMGGVNAPPPPGVGPYPGVTPGTHDSSNSGGSEAPPALALNPGGSSSGYDSNGNWVGWQTYKAADGNSYRLGQGPNPTYGMGGGGPPSPPMTTNTGLRTPGAAPPPVASGGIHQPIHLGLSDEDEKTDKAQDPKDVQQMLDHLHAYSYRYKNPDAPGAAPGRRLGVMAQDLEKSPLGASFVHDTDQGKMVDYGQAHGTMMAALAMLNDRMNKVEGRDADAPGRKGA